MADIKNTKNLCTVATDVVSDNTNFIVEDNKELKRVPKDQVIINSLTQLMANDTSNLLTGGEVSAQEILDVIADKVANKLLAKNQIINNLLATEVGNVLDATQGKVLMDKITQLNSDLPNNFKFKNLKFDVSSSYDTEVLRYIESLKKAVFIIYCEHGSASMYMGFIVSDGKYGTVLRFEYDSLYVNGCAGSAWTGWTKLR